MFYNIKPDQINEHLGIKVKGGNAKVSSSCYGEAFLAKHVWFDKMSNTID